MKFARSVKTFFGLCCLASACSALADAEEATTLEPNESTTKAQPNLIYAWKYIRPCYIEKSRAAELLIRMNTTVQILRKKDRFLDCPEGAKFVNVPAKDFQLCSDERIAKIQDDLASLTGSLFEMAIRLQEPQETQVRNLDVKKFELLDSLQALRIFYGPLHSQCDESKIVLLPFDASVTYLELSLNSVLALFQTTRPTRATLPPTTTTSTSPSTTSTSSTTFPPTSTPAPKPTIEQIILNPNTTFAELLDMDRLYPDVMSEALPQVISQRYAGHVSNFKTVLNFVEALNTTENQITGFNAMYETIRRYPKLPPLPLLLKLEESVNHLYAFASSFLQSNLEDLMKDLGPLALIGERSDCNITNVAYRLGLDPDDAGWPESIYLHPTETYRRKWRVYPTVQSNKFNFRIRDLITTRFLYAADHNPNSHTSAKIYSRKPSERYILHNEFATSREVDWKLVAVAGKLNTFRILTAKSGDVMFAHKSATGYGGYRRVILGRASTSTHDFIPDADLWQFTCQPGKPSSRDRN